MAGISFMAGKIDSPIDIDRQIKILLDKTMIMSFVPVIAAPWFIGYKFKFKRFFRR